MDQESEKKLAEIIALGVGALTEPDIEFLKARRSYLNEEQLAVFKDVLAEPEDNTVDLKKLNKDQLAELATSLGLNPEDYSKKADLIAAIEEKQNQS